MNTKYGFENKKHHLIARVPPAKGNASIIAKR